MTFPSRSNGFPHPHVQLGHVDRKAGSWSLVHLFKARPVPACHFLSLCIIASGIFIMFTFILLFVSGFSAVNAGLLGRQASASSSAVPQYFQTMPELYAGPTPTGVPAFLAQTNPAPFGTVSYIPNTPLETQVPISGNTNNANIYQLHGQLSHYFPNPV